MSEGPAKPRSGFGNAVRLAVLLFPCVWLLASFAIARFTNEIKFGDPDGFHGQGWPLPVVVFDKPAGSDRFLDYPNPVAGMFLNPAIYFVAGIAGWCVCLGIWYAVNRLLEEPPEHPA
ncbi:MAG: hypothetical protein L6R28_24725 [Planctomycetes bacterium]|nr:hypothetical protein [Planctomycetota bacterium]